jgi:hypothetical protein
MEAVHPAPISVLPATTEMASATLASLLSLTKTMNASALMELKK